jgi:hypothetical protein
MLNSSNAVGSIKITVMNMNDVIIIQTAFVFFPPSFLPGHIPSRLNGNGFRR